MKTKPKCAVPIQAFYKALERHDWYFGWSDDPRAYREGEASYAALEAVARAGGEEYQWLLDEYSKHCFTGTPWGTVQHPKPPAPGSTPADPSAKRYVGGRKGGKGSLQWFYLQPKPQSMWLRIANRIGITAFVANIPCVRKARIIYKRLVAVFTTPIY